MAPRDAIAERNATDEAAAFNSRVMDAKDEIVALVDTLMRWGGSAKYRGRTFYGGNVVLLVERGVGGERVVVQYPSPGVIHSEWRNELLENEVTALDVLGTFTTIPLPRVLFWGHADQSPRQLGPFLIRECLMTRGKPLTRLIGVPVRNGKEGELVLNPDVPDAVMDVVYEELAHMLLKVARMAFNRIGAISRSEVPCRWEVTWQPLTHDMNEVATMGDFPIDEFGKTGAFESAGAFFYARAHQFGIHLYRQRNIAGDDPNTAWKQFNARRFFGDAIPKYCTVEDDTGPFRFFCEGLQPANILVDDRTLRITGVANLGFANAMPAQYVHDLP
ncbi:hypothetical protein BT67DRAFT_445208 [Trichocladium antarcticum]|uniref:Aminoglycoside phosphotransferase domain-containing protein n=1 Tax=Trichocladium antarcticum TaxID=1450529 RepID=A0AAN6UD98_9PEZI|nr:hypothetical protein BT67DRAFT_445208 [Trichocladium antarcticum]